jgi:hypothetical protein
MSVRVCDSVRGMMSNARTHLNRVARAIDMTDEAGDLRSIANLGNVNDLKTAPADLTKAYPAN